ncbi:MAG: hypothetical protein K2P69_01135 [Eubacterium sp.]|nr:hypothetical protein [Eubacterium sp.]
MDTDRMNREQICRIIIEKIEYIKKAEHTGKEKLKKTEEVRDIQQTEEKRNNEFLTGPYWNLTAEHMVYLYYEICRQFQLQIEVRDLEQYRFATVSGIADIVAARLTDRCR